MSCPRLEEAGLLLAGALQNSEAEAYLLHVEGCQECRKRLAEEQLVADALAFSGSRVEPRPELKRRILVRAALSRMSRLPTWAAAAVALAFLCYGYVAQHRIATLQAALAKAQHAGPVYAVSRLTSTGIDPNARGSAVMMPQDRRMMVIVEGLAPAGKGEVYELWLVKPGGIMAAGALTVYRDGAGWLEGPLPTGGYQEILVSLEPRLHPARIQGPVVLKGKPQRT